MKFRTSLYFAVAGIALTACASTPMDTTQVNIPDKLDLVAAPQGVTLQPLGLAQGYDLSAVAAAALARDEIVYANENGLTLYTRDQDPIGQSTCIAECMDLFKPHLVSAQASSSAADTFGSWSVIDREDGTQQWALNGKALYTYVRDVDPGSVGGESPAIKGALRMNGAGEKVGGGNRGDFDASKVNIEPMPEGWNVATLYPLNDVKVPPGFAVKEIPDAAAFALVDNNGHTVYAFGGENAATAENGTWTPMAAPQMARPVGEFSFLMRDDGIRQWTFNGRPLFTYKGDLAPTYANGFGVDGRFDVAAVAKYHLPAGVTLQNTPGQGRVLATAEGMTLYRRDGHILQSGGGHSLRRGQPARPAVGRDLGTDPRCSSGCESWHPFLAPADAQPRGFWNVAGREDGTRQWTYQGYALWTYDGDQKPGDMNGHDVYELFFAHDANTLIDIGTPMDGSAALWWSIAVP